MDPCKITSCGLITDHLSAQVMQTVGCMSRVSAFVSGQHILSVVTQIQTHRQIATHTHTHTQHRSHLAAFGASQLVPSPAVSQNVDRTSWPSIRLSGIQEMNVIRGPDHHTTDKQTVDRDAAMLLPLLSCQRCLMIRCRPNYRCNKLVPS